jgi:hypothetical protein
MVSFGDDPPGGGSAILDFVKHQGLPSDKDSEETILVQIIEELQTVTFWDSSANEAVFYYTTGNTRRLAYSDDGLFISRINAEFYRRTGRTVEEKKIGRILGVYLQLKGEPARIRTGVRMVRDEGNCRTLIDLGGPSNEVVEIADGVGWKKIQMDVPPFRERESRLELTSTTEGPDPGIKGLRPFLGLLNIDRDLGTEAVMAGYLVSLFVPHIPRVILLVDGEHACGKSTIHRNIKWLVDPVDRDQNSYIEQLSSIDSEEGLWIEAHKEYLVYFDNESRMDEATANALCKLITGGSRSTRKLYTNRDRSVLGGIRPLGINTIEPGLIRRHDLNSRILTVRVPQLAGMSSDGTGIITEREMELKVGKTMAASMRALLEAAVDAQAVPEQGAAYVAERWEGEKPRSQDARMLAWIAVCFAGIEHLYSVAGEDPKAALSAAQQHLGRMWEEHRQKEAESNPVVGLVIDWLKALDGGYLPDRCPRHTFPIVIEPADLYSEVNVWISQSHADRRFWAGSPESLGKQLAKNGPYLRERGYEVRKEKRYSSANKASRRFFIIDKIDQDEKYLTEEQLIELRKQESHRREEAAIDATWKALTGEHTDGLD